MAARLFCTKTTFALARILVGLSAVYSNHSRFCIHWLVTNSCQSTGLTELQQQRSDRCRRGANDWTHWRVSRLITLVNDLLIFSITSRVFQRTRRIFNAFIGHLTATSKLWVFGATTHSMQTVATRVSNLKIENNFSRPVRHARPTRSMGAKLAGTWNHDTAQSGVGRWRLRHLEGFVRKAN